MYVYNHVCRYICVCVCIYVCIYSSGCIKLVRQQLGRGLSCVLTSGSTSARKGFGLLEAPAAAGVWTTKTQKWQPEWPVVIWVQ